MKRTSLCLIFVVSALCLTGQAAPLSGARAKAAPAPAPNPTSAPSLEAAYENDPEFKQAKEYYSRWLGAPAPPLGSDARDRTTGPRIDLAKLKGKRVLLFGFDSGNFVEAADEDALLAVLQAVDRPAAGK